MDSPLRLIPEPSTRRPRPRFAICTLGCKLNQSDEADVRRGLRQAGLVEVDFASEADVYIVNTCTVTHLADRRSRQMLRRARRQNPDALVAAIGCYPAVNPQELVAMPEVDLVVGSIEKLTVVDDILGSLGVDNMAFDADEPVEQLETRTRRMIKIQEGCRAHCTYCIIPQARGAPRNIAPDEVARMVQEAADAGYREVVLTGTHVGTYKWPRSSGSSGETPAIAGTHDQFLRLADLLEQLLERTTIERLRVTSVGPHEIDERFIRILSHPRMAPHLHMALQSGSETVLRRMKRWYNLRQFRRAVRRLREEIPEIGITTDVIVGFPGETEAEFEETCAFVREMGFAKLHVFPYSARKSTPAAGMPDQVPPRLKEARSARLRAIGDELHAAFVARHVEADLHVLVEQVAEERPDGMRVWSGLTPNYLRVYLPSSDDLENRFVVVRGERAYLDGVLGSEPLSIS